MTPLQKHVLALLGDQQPCHPGGMTVKGPAMLESQRTLFDLPRDVCWLNAAAYSPIPQASRDAGERGIARKVRPWEMEGGNAPRQFERARAAAARLINADPNDVALIPSVSYGVATAGRALPLPKGSRVLVLEDDHSFNPRP